MANPAHPSTAPRFQRQRERAGKLPLSVKVFQGLGALPEALKGFAFNTFLLLFYNQVLGLSASMAGAALLVGVAVDAVTDPLVGTWSDGLKSRLGRRHPLMYASVLPLLVTLWALFSPPQTLDAAGLGIWLLVFAVAARVSMTLFQVPWSALFVELSDDYVERSELVAFRWAFGILGVAVFTVLSWGVVFQSSEAFPEGQLDPGNYGLFAGMLAVSVAGAALLSTLLTQRDVPFLLQPEEGVGFSFARASGDLRAALRLPNFRRLFVGLLFTATLTGTVEALRIYLSTYFWELTPEDLQWYAVAALGAFAAIAAVPALNRRFDKRLILVVAMGVSILDAIILVSLRFAGILPENGEPLLLPILVANEVFRAFLVVLVGTMFVSMIADTVDEQELATGRRQEGVFSAAVSFSNKAISGLGILFAGLLLDHVIELTPDTSPGEVAADNLVRLGAVMGYLVPALYVLPLFVLLGYSLSRERHSAIRAALDARHGTERVSLPSAAPADLPPPSAVSPLPETP